jgi:hypothetical protein
MEPNLFKTQMFSDNRGTLFPLALDNRWIQSNVSISKQWTFRGLHHQTGETSQSKLVTVIRGVIFDVIVDLRGSQFGTVHAFELRPGEQIYVPKGFAHGFLAMAQETIVQYLVDSPYSPGNEVCFNWKSVDTVREEVLNRVGEESRLIISEKDAAGIDLSPTIFGL